MCTWHASSGTLHRCYPANQLLHPRSGSNSGGGCDSGSSSGDDGGEVCELSCGCLDDRGRRIVLGDSRGRLVVVDLISGHVVGCCFGGSGVGGVVR